METIKYKGYTIRIEQDHFAEDPIAEWDGNAKYALFHNRYRLQNDTDLDPDDYGGWDELEEALIKKYKPFALLPVYMYSHSGDTISTSPFSCRWDSGQIGFVFVDRERFCKDWGREFKERHDVRKIEQDLKDNVKLYDHYITGEVYRVDIMEDGDDETIDCCGGYYGSDHEANGLMDGARNTIDNLPELVI